MKMGNQPLQCCIAEADFYYTVYYTVSALGFSIDY